MPPTTNIASSEPAHEDQGIPMLLYANQMLYRTSDGYTARKLNFIDFLAAIAQPQSR